MSNLLPIGSIIKKKEDNTQFIVIGYYPVNTLTSMLYQYLCAYYPAGFSHDTPVAMLNNDDISEIVFEGYSNDDSKVLVSELSKGIEK